MIFGDSGNTQFLNGYSNSEHYSKFKKDLLAYFNVPEYRSEKKFKNATEYAEELNKWLLQCYSLQCFYGSLPFMVANSPQNQPYNTQVTANDAASSNQTRPAFVTRDQNGNIQELSLGRDYLIPPLWKRFVSEMIDFFLLLVVQLVVVLLLVDYMELFNLEKLYDFQSLQEEQLSYHLYLQVTTEILLLEVLHRLVVCVYEALCLYQGLRAPGGATPGKSLMRLRVVSCHTVTISPANPNFVRVYPAQNIGFGWAMLRAFIKNFYMAIFFPALFTMFFFQHNRAIHDLFCNTIVVEDPA